MKKIQKKLRGSFNVFSNSARYLEVPLTLYRCTLDECLMGILMVAIRIKVPLLIQNTFFLKYPLKYIHCENYFYNSLKSQFYI